MATPLHGGRTKARGSERGAALLTAMVAVAVLTAFAVDLAYSSRVTLQIAANGRDELRAQYLARSGVAMGRLVLDFQRRLDTAMGQAQNIPRVQLWNLVPVDQSLTESLFGGGGGGSGGAGASLFDTPQRKKPGAGSLFATQEQKPAQRAAGGAAPTFDARIEDEGQKVNAQFRGFNSGVDQTLRQRVQSLYQLVCDPRWDPLFDREDARGQRTTREELLVFLRDWVNEGNASSALRPGSGSTSAPCGLVVNWPAFENAFADKNQRYDRGDDRYKTKNAKMDSLDELYLVAGIDDAFMAAFGDSLTVYGDKLNLNSTDKQRLAFYAALIAQPPNQPALRDPEFPDRLAKAILIGTAGGILSMTPQQFGLYVAAAGVTVNQNLLQTGPNSPFTDRATVFRIRATGKVGAVRSGIDAVVKMDDQIQKLPGDQLAQPGRIIHWREE